MWNINAPQGRIPCAIFYKICRVCTLFQDMLAVKISLDLLKRLWSYGGFKLRGLVIPKCSALPSGETMTAKVLEVQERARGPLSPCQVWWGSDFTRRRGCQKTLSFLFVGLAVCLFVTLLNVRDCATDFAMKVLEYRNDFDAVG